MRPMKTNSLSESRYVVVFTHDLSRKSFVYFMRTKVETLEKFKIFNARIEVETGKRLKMLHTDRGGEFVLEAFIGFCNNHGIK